ncbi:vacuolar protein sorting-associated protein 11 homolog [Planococcus citri]|uniref:vacuolar protein sorting-associated protein 11 homolog n=1 Tax=Planococcus citri TaxID=170843 RepID=UPI0031F8C80D
MSFLEWRRFNFFDLKRKVDNGNIERVLGNTSITAISAGHGTLTICDSEGVIHLVNRSFQVTTFQGYLIGVYLAAQPKSVPILVTIGEDEEGNEPLIKVWDLEKQDRQGNPVCLKNLRGSSISKQVKASALCVSDSAHVMAVGFTNGAIILFRGNLIRDRAVKQRLIRNGNDRITGLAFKSVGKYSHLFVSTEESVLQYNITIKDREEEVLLDNCGCSLKCSVLADSTIDCPFMVARNDAIYCYSVDGRGPCYAVDGIKVCLQWFRNYLIIVAQDNTDANQSPVTVSSTNSNENGISEKGRYAITVLDIQNKFIVFSSILKEIVAVFSEWGSFYILTKDHNLHHFQEKDLQSKLALLFKKNLYDVSIRIAKNQQYDTDSLTEIFRQYGDHLYSKGDHNGAMDQYIKTIGKLEPSYVIRKFLDSQHIDNLIRYLSALHKQGLATGDHTTLLLNCYTKLNDIHKLKEFILTKDRDIDFDINIAISVCRKSSSEDALILAEKHGLHLWYIKILLEDQRNYSAALQYIAKLEFIEAYEMIMKFGDTLIQHIPSDFTLFLKKLCTCYYPSDTLLLDQDDQETAHQANPQDFIHLFLNHSDKMVEFLEYLTQFSSKWSSSVYNTLIEHYLHLWFSSTDISEKLLNEQKIMATLQSPEINYDKNQALLLCTIRNFKAGLLFLLEENKQYKEILRYQLNSGNYQDVLSCCRRFGYQEPSLWVTALRSASNDSFFPSDILCEILAVIEKEHLLAPLQVVEIVSKSKSLSVGDVKNYFLSVLKTESKVIDEEDSLIKKYQVETQNMREHIEKIKNSSILFQGAFCSMCKSRLELPSVHFLCQHSFHQHCYQTYMDRENECIVCLPNNQKILGVIKSQEQGRDLHETFHSQLERAEDPFSLIADYIGRNIFSKVTVDPELTRQLQKPFKAMLRSKPEQPSISRAPRDTAEENKNTNEFKTNKEDKSKMSTLEANISPLRESPVHMYAGDSLMGAVENKSTQPATSTNPFDEYDEEKNPFFGDEEEQDDDGYDKRLNPFA